MNESKNWFPKLIKRTMPDFGQVSTVAFPVGVDEDVTYRRLMKDGMPAADGKASPAVFPMLDDGYDDGSEFRFVQLDPEFYLREVMAVDPDDTEELLAFMSRYGLLTSPRRVPFIGRPIPSRTIATPADIVGLAGFTEVTDEDVADAERVRVELNARHDNAVDRASLITTKVEDDRVTITANPAPYYAPLWECSETLSWLQETIRTLVELWRNGCPKDGGELAEKLVELDATIMDMTSCIDPYFPSAELVHPDVFALWQPGSTWRDLPTNADMRSGERCTRSVYLPLTVAILVQLITGLQADEGYKVCPHCGRTFMFKRSRVRGSKIERAVARRSNATYCSEACQRAANRAKDHRKNHAKKHDGNEEGGQES